MRLTLDRFALSKELHEHADLGAQNLGMKRLEDVVDRAELVAAEHTGLVPAHRGQKNDRRVMRFVALANQAGGLESVQIGHLHVEQDHRKFTLQQRPQRLATRLSLDKVLVHVGQDRLQSEQVRALIDQKNIDAFVSHGVSATRQRSARNAAIPSRFKI